MFKQFSSCYFPTLFFMGNEFLMDPMIDEMTPESDLEFKTKAIKELLTDVE